MTCDVARCRKPMLLSYGAFTSKRAKDRWVCEFHWKKHCDDGNRFDLRTHFFPDEEIQHVDKVVLG